MADDRMKKEITVKRISALKFEIEVSVEMTKTEIASEALTGCRKPEDASDGHNRISVIKRAPPARAKRELPPPRDCLVRLTSEYACRRRYGEDANPTAAGAVLIKDAILYRIIEILLWKLLPEENLISWGYPTTPTYKLLWRVVHHYSHRHPEAGAPSDREQDHDCQGDIGCFMDHVGNFLRLCAPTPDRWDKFGWTRLSREEILNKIYFEDLLPYLSKADLSNYGNILSSYRDILQLQKWQEQGFTAISWNGHQHFSRLRSRLPWCPQCSRHLRKSVISY